MDGTCLMTSKLWDKLKHTKLQIKLLSLRDLFKRLTAEKYVLENLRIQTLFMQDMHQIYEYKEKELNSVVKSCPVSF